MNGVQVTVEQLGHEFLFGCNIYMFDRYRSEAQNAAYKQRFEGLFNYATVGFYWRWYESQRGKPQYEYTDKVVEWCRQRGIRLKGHPLLWGSRSGVPPWSQSQPSPEIQRQRVVDIMQRYQGRIEFWEVVNEPSHLAEPRIDQPYRWARQADPGAYLIVSFSFRGFFGEYRVAIELPGGKVERQFQLRTSGAKEIVMSLAATTNR